MELHCIFILINCLNIIIKHNILILIIIRYLYSASVIKDNIAKIRSALRVLNEEREGINIFYAMKANRFRDVIDVIRSEGDIGIYTLHYKS